jgi:hypothetical protein
MPKRSRATLKGLALAKLQRLDRSAYRGHLRKTDIAPCHLTVRCPPTANGRRCQDEKYDAAIETRARCARRTAVH